MFKTNSLFSIALFAGLITIGQLAQAATQFHRLAWDRDPAHSAVVGFSPKFDAWHPLTRDRRVKWGHSTNEQLWKTVIPKKSVFIGSALPNLTPGFNPFKGPVVNGILPSYFARLTGLHSDSKVFYRICETRAVNTTVCGQRFWFRTAPTKETPFVFVAGGDTRGGFGGGSLDIIGLKPGNSNKAGNELVSKIRPLFVMHGGDYTNSNSARQWRNYLSEWQLTHANDKINGIPYKQIFPIIPTLGNHESLELDTLCKVFGVDYNGDNKCNVLDTYGAMNVSPLMRAYILNTELGSSSRRAAHLAMNSWLARDLRANYANHKNKWRVGQYHKPIFPNTDSKSKKLDQFTAWASSFYNYGMDLVVESDSHVVKATFPLKPNLSQKKYDKADATGGTTFVGEGSWAAASRTPNGEQGDLLLTQGGFNQFKVVTVSKSQMEVRTAKFDGNEQRLSATARDNNRTLLPNGVNWWSWNYLGKSTNVMKLSKTPQGRSTFTQNRIGRVNVAVRQSSDDAEERASDGHVELDSSDLEFHHESRRGNQYVGIRFQRLNIPKGATITQAYIQFTTDERSSRSPAAIYFRTDVTDNSPTFTRQARNVSKRLWGARATVKWQNNHQWYTIGKKRNTPDLSSIVQPIINRAGWRPGNSMSFLVYGSGKRTTESYDGSRSQAPRLIVEYKY